MIFDPKFPVQKLIKIHAHASQRHSRFVGDDNISVYANFQLWRWLGRSFLSHFLDFMGVPAPHEMLIFPVLFMGVAASGAGTIKFALELISKRSEPSLTQQKPTVT